MRNLKLMRALAVAVCLVSAFAMAEPMDSPECKPGLAKYVAGDYERAAEILAPLADAGDACAQHWLGIMYQTGNGVKKNHDFAMALWQKAADQGYGPSIAQVALGQE